MINAQIDLLNEFIDDELFLIVLHELAVQEGSVFALKIKARLYKNEFAGKQDEWSKAEHRRLSELKRKFALNKKEKSRQETLKDIATKMLELGKRS